MRYWQGLVEGTMLFDISRLRTGVDDVNRSYAPEAFADLTDDMTVSGPTDVVGTVSRDGRTAVVLKARVTSAFETRCSRCLESYAVPVDAEVETRFVPPAEFATVTAATAAKDGALLKTGAARPDEVESDVKDHDFGLAEYHDEAIDLGAVVREQLYLALPMKPLCTEACKGLCPVCGVNWNRETCECQQEWVDPRMAVLAEWTSRNEKTKG
ncbi:MAG: DUF177 domain-containing protein [Acidobacteria bacterium]|nr:DUF177 domain-containing protein [Acidobacteriota bacterium]